MKLWGFHAKSHGENTLTWGDDGLAMFVVTWLPWTPIFIAVWYFNIALENRIFT
jgi:hypothetical protein